MFHMRLLILLYSTFKYHCVLGNAVSQEVCHMEVFSGECTHDHIIYMESALYGLLHIGRCWPDTNPSIGCMNNIIGYFDQKCSGKRRCSVETMDKYLGKLNTNCPRHIAPFIEVSYICIQGT